MLRIVALLVTALSLFAFHAAGAEEAADNPGKRKQTSDGDRRQLVSMPAQAREFMRQDMLSHLVAIDEIIGHLANNKLDAAAKVAETRLGKSTMGKHRGTGMGPGRFMPPAMRNLGWDMHDSASEFARVAIKGDAQRAHAALQKVTAACVACHLNYRTR